MALTIYTYLDSVSVRSACMDYIDYLHAENDAYKTIKTRIENFINDTDSTSSSIVGIKDQMDDYSLIIQELVRANEFDIDSCWKLHDNSGSGVYDGYTIFKNKNEASGNYSFNYDKGEEYAKKAYNETNDSLKEEYGKKASDYYGIAREIKKELEYWEGREAEYDEIESCTANCFQESVELRSRAMTGLGEISTSFNKGEYARKNSAWRDEIKDDLAKDVILDLRVNPDRADITLNNITDEEIKELIALQMAPYDYLPQAQKDRLKELEDLLLVSNPGAWATYYSLAGSLDNDSVRLLIERLKGEGFCTDFVYQGGSNLATAADQYATFKELHELYPTNNYYANMCILYEQKYYEELDAAFESLPRSEDFAAAYQYLRDTNTDPREMAGILDYWAQFEDGDSLENCMPDWWVEAHLSGLDFEVNEDNVLDFMYDDDMRAAVWAYYYQGPYVVDLICGMGDMTSANGFTFDAANIVGIPNLPEYWYYYTYGGMIDYVNGISSPKAIKYALETYYGFENLTTSIGYYTVYTDEIDSYYRFCISFFLDKYDLYEDYYENWRTSSNDEYQLLKYIRQHIGDALTQDELDFINENYEACVDTGMYAYKPIAGIGSQMVDTLNSEMNALLSCEYYEVVQNPDGSYDIVFHFLRVDMYDDEYREEFEISMHFSADEVKDGFISIEAYNRETMRFSAEFLSLGLLSGTEEYVREQTLEELNSAIDALDYLTEEEKERAKELMAISYNQMYLMEQTFYKDGKRDADIVKEEVQFAVKCVGLACALVAMAFPGVDAVAIAGFAMTSLANTAEYCFVNGVQGEDEEHFIANTIEYIISMVYDTVDASGVDLGMLGKLKEKYDLAGEAKELYDAFTEE